MCYSEGSGNVGLTTGRSVAGNKTNKVVSQGPRGSSPPQHRAVVSPRHVTRADERWGTAYELSQELHDKQVEMLERKYGGQLRAQRAARRIQQVYRNYRMNKKFGELLETFDERRITRRMAEFSRSKTIWTDRATGGMDQAGGHWTRYYSSEEVSAAVPMVGSETQETTSTGQQVTVRREVATSGGSSRFVNVTHKSNSMVVSARDKQFVAATVAGRAGRAMCLDLSTIAENLPTVTVTQSPTPPAPPPRGSTLPSSAPVPCDRLQYPDLDSSASDSPPHDHPLIDLPSVTFEATMDYPEAEVLNDSFHSDSSHEAAPCGTLTPVFTPCTPGDCDPPAYTSSTLTRTAIPIYGEAAPIYTQHPVYDKSEVRLRKVKADALHGCLGGDSETQSLGSCDGRSVGSLEGRSTDEQGLSSHGSEVSMGSQEGNTYNRGIPTHHYTSHTLTRGSDRQRKRTYRVGLNLFNK